MSDYKNELNTHLKSLYARLDRVDSDLRSHFAAQYLQGIAFAANPLTAAQGAIMLAQFASKSAFNALADQIPGVELFKQLQHLDAAGLLDSLSSNLSNIANGIVNTAVANLEGAIDAKVTALRNYTAGLIENASAEVMAPLETALNDATSALDTADTAARSIQGFMGSLGDITAEKTISSVIRI